MKHKKRDKFWHEGRNGSVNGLRGDGISSSQKMTVKMSASLFLGKEVSVT